MKRLLISLAIFLGFGVFAADEETTPDSYEFDLIIINHFADGEAASLSLRLNGRRLRSYPIRTTTLANSEFVGYYDYYHANRDSVSYWEYMPDPYLFGEVHDRHDLFITPNLSGTTSLERLAKVVAYVKGNAGEEAALLAARAGDMSLLKHWSAWLTHVAVLGLSHANRNDSIKWALIEQNMDYTMEVHFAEANAAQWDSVFSAVDTSTAFHFIKTHTRTSLGLNPSDDLPTRLKAPDPGRYSVAFPVVTSAYLDEARTLVFDGVLPYLDSTMRGPSAP